MKNSNAKDGHMNRVTRKRTKSSSSSSYSSDQCEHQLSNSLSESLLFEIFLRVPSRAVHRWKSVCKAWNSLISSNYFVMSFNHFRHGPSLPPIPPDSAQNLHGLIFKLNHYRSDHHSYGIVKFLRNGSRCSTPTSHYRAHEVLDLSFLPTPESEIEVRASFADLLLCSLEESSPDQGLYTHFYVCNIFNRQWFALPQADHNSFHMVPEPIGFLCVHAPCSLCSHSPEEQCIAKDNSRYKFAVVRIIRQYVSKFETQLYSSENGVWRNYVVSIPREIERESEVLTSMVAYRGMLHWLNHDSILVYDPFNSPERLSRVISLPPRPHAPLLQRENIDFWVVHSFGLQHGEDSLCVALGHGPKDPVVYIWNLEDYETGKWSLVSKIPHTYKEFYVKRFRKHEKRSMMAMYIHIDGNAICKFKDSSALWLRNTKRGTMTALDNFDSTLNLGRLTVHPVVNQLWPTPVPPQLPMRPCTSKDSGNINTTGKLKEEREA